MKLLFLDRKFKGNKDNVEQFLSSVQKC